MKNFMNKKLLKSLFSILVLPVLLFTSCENFLSGSLLEDELTASIEYANSPSFTVYISPENSASGSLISASVKENCKVSDTISLDFKLADGYKFIC